MNKSFDYSFSNLKLLFCLRKLNYFVEQFLFKIVQKKKRFFFQICLKFTSKNDKERKTLRIKILLLKYPMI